MECSYSREWKQLLGEFSSPNSLNSILQLGSNLACYFAIMWLSISLARQSVIYPLLLAFPAACFTLRLFSIQHDCGHRAFFKTKWANSLVGRLVSPITLTPYRFWQLSHARHHANIGHLDRQGFGDIEVLTVKEYNERSWISKLQYRAYRNPWILFLLGPIYLYFIRFRLAYGLPSPKLKTFLSINLLNLSLVCICLLMEYFVGISYFLMAFVPTMTISATVGVWLFYMHHYFEGTYWKSNETWDSSDAKLQGSSYYELPKFAHFFTGNTGIHHIHHINPRIPNYRLQACLEKFPELKKINPISFIASFKFLKLALWDEEAERMITFKELSME